MTGQGPAANLIPTQPNPRSRKAPYPARVNARL
jgi:hypothetical protein